MPKNYDFQAWTKQVEQFHQGLQKLPGDLHLEFSVTQKLSPDALAALEQNWPNGIPQVLRSLWSTGCAGMQCFYIWEQSDDVFFSDSLYGGVDFVAAEDVFPGNSGANPGDELLRETVGVLGHELLCRCAIFHQFGNGDCLGFDPLVNPDDPAVVHLIHDDQASKQISPTFTEFLEKWSRAAFLWPHHWEYGQWPFQLTQAQRDEVAGLLELAEKSGF